MKTFMYSALLSIPAGAYQEFSRNAYQGQVIASLGIGSLLFPSLAFFNRAGKDDNEIETTTDTALVHTTAGMWGGAIGYFIGLMSGSLARLYRGRDTVEDSRALRYAWRMSEAFFYGTGERLGKRIAASMIQRIFG